MSHNLQRSNHFELHQKVASLPWYHTIDLGNGLVTPGAYDHRPYLPYYGIPDDLTGKTVLDVGAASGFFSFEMEQRGAKVTATDLPAWFAHDFGPNYQPDQTAEEGQRYLHDPLAVAKRARNSQIEKIETTIYNISPQTVGMHDIVFCGSVLLHLTDPERALWCLQSVTRELAIIATGLYQSTNEQPLALFVGHERGDAWWLPNRLCLERMVQSAGFQGVHFFSEFRLDYRDGQPGPYHGVVHAWNTSQPPQTYPLAPTPPSAQPNAMPATQIDPRDAEIERLRTLVAGYERGRFMRAMRWLKRMGSPTVEA